MDAHKRVLAAIYIAWGVVDLLLLALIYNLFNVFLVDYLDHEVLTWLELIIPTLLWFLILFVAVPSIIGGIGLLYNQKWALILVLIQGCLALINFPIGTALGVYTLWVYFEDEKRKKDGTDPTVARQYSN